MVLTVVFLSGQMIPGRSTDDLWIIHSTWEFFKLSFQLSSKILKSSSKIWQWTLERRRNSTCWTTRRKVLWTWFVVSCTLSLREKSEMNRLCLLWLSKWRCASPNLYSRSFQKAFKSHSMCSRQKAFKLQFTFVHLLPKLWAIQAPSPHAAHQFPYNANLSPHLQKCTSS
jgi:hypothetical protein